MNFKLFTHKGQDVIVNLDNVCYVSERQRSGGEKPELIFHFSGKDKFVAVDSHDMKEIKDLLKLGSMKRTDPNILNQISSSFP